MKMNEKVHEERAIKLVNDDEPPISHPTNRTANQLYVHRLCVHFSLSFEFPSQQEDVTLRSQVDAAVWVCVCVWVCVLCMHKK